MKILLFLSLVSTIISSALTDHVDRLFEVSLRVQTYNKLLNIPASRSSVIIPEPLDVESFALDVIEKLTPAQQGMWSQAIDRVNLELARFVSNDEFCILSSVHSLAAIHQLMVVSEVDVAHALHILGHGLTSHQRQKVSAVVVDILKAGRPSLLRIGQMLYIALEGRLVDNATMDRLIRFARICLEQPVDSTIVLSLIDEYIGAPIRTNLDPILYLDDKLGLYFSIIPNLTVFSDMVRRDTLGFPRSPFGSRVDSIDFRERLLELSQPLLMVYSAVMERILANDRKASLIRFLALNVLIQHPECGSTKRLEDMLTSVVSHDLLEHTRSSAFLYVELPRVDTSNIYALEAMNILMDAAVVSELLPHMEMVETIQVSLVHNFDMIQAKEPGMMRKLKGSRRVVDGILPCTV